MSTSPEKVELTGLQTESRNVRSGDIDHVSVQELCRILNREDETVPKAVAACIPEIAKVIETLTERVRNGGRVFSIGAGTSGRLGVLDASEIPPTFSAPSDQFVALIAGGDGALRKAKEGAEDSRVGAEMDLAPYNLDPKWDSLIGIASSGRTPYVLGGLAYAKALGCTTIGLVCVEPSAVADEGNADHVIAPVTGPEVVTGSTRMKAGTATKLVLNMISTGIMIRLGKTYGNLMIDVKATNLKLKQRARNILRQVSSPGLTHSDEELDQVLASCENSVKLAAAVLILGVSRKEAEARLEESKGVLEHVLRQHRIHHNGESLIDEHQSQDMVLCVDAGGSSCKAVIASKNGNKAMGEAGPCNISTVGVEAAIAEISRAIQRAADNHSQNLHSQFFNIPFSSIWIGIAGYDRPALKSQVQEAVSKLFQPSIRSAVKITTDIDLLPVAMSARQDIGTVIALVAGTGSIAMSYERQNNGFQRTGRAGGWGHLLGDDGSGYSLGREAIRKALRFCDADRLSTFAKQHNQSPTPLVSAILSHFQSQCPESTTSDLLSSVMLPESSSDAHETPTKRVASAAQTVLSMSHDEEAQAIMNAGASSLADLVAQLVEGHGWDVNKSGLVLAGGLMQNEVYRALVLALLMQRVGRFAGIEFVSQPAAVVASSLVHLNN